MFTISWKIGRVAGIDLYLHPTLLLLFLYLGLSGQSLLLVAALFGCVLLHELGHALTARRFGIATADITLYPIGGVARLRRLPKKPGPELLIALAGPAVNVVIAAVLGLGLALAALAGISPMDGEGITSFVVQLLALNLGLALFNLIPAFPMDGGRVLRALLGGWLGRLRATEIAAAVGQILAVGFGLWVLLSGGSFIQVFLAIFVFMAAAQERAQVRAEESWDDGPPDDHRGDPVRVAPPGYTWFYRGGGQWRLAPIAVTVDPRRNPGPYRPWR